MRKHAVPEAIFVEEDLSEMDLRKAGSLVLAIIVDHTSLVATMNSSFDGSTNVDLHLRLVEFHVKKHGTGLSEADREEMKCMYLVDSCKGPAAAFIQRQDAETTESWQLLKEAMRMLLVARLVTPVACIVSPVIH